MASDLASMASSNDSYVESEDDDGSEIRGPDSTTESDRNSITHTDSLHGASTGDSVADSIAKKDTTAACQLRVLMVTLFLVMSVFVPVIIFVTTRDNEQESFESEFDALATKVVDSFDFNMARKLGAIDSLDISITSYAVGTNSTFPFVTLPDFDLRAANTLALADTFSVLFVPLVTQANRVKWETYSVENEAWITTALNRQTASVERRAQETLGLVAPSITAFDPDGALVRQPDGAEPYFPIWQNAPVDTSIVNFNLASVGSFTAGILQMVETKEAVLGEAAEFSPNELLIEQYYEQLLVDEDADYRGEPVSNLFYPVFDKFERDHELVGMLNIVIFWHAFFTGILPSNAKGIICVVNNACGQSFTYRIDGQETYYVGMGDLHDGSYDNLKQVYKINDVKQSSSFTFRETAIPLNKDHCPYNLTVYPSQTLEDEYVTYKPALYTFLIALAFLLISAVAITYDCVVQRRLKTVLDSALESRAIVSSLFPANVRDRLFEDDGNGKVQKKERTFGESADDKNSDKDRILASHPAKLRLKNFLDEGPAGDVPDANILQSKPIADLFPHCTVLFTDIAGFTAWSSEREPAQVFMLLQTLFHFFDNIARKWGVFKVETIGDCYVAVTGLPDPQADHAIRMTKFARECLHKVNDLTHKLESTLGPDTGDLKMRFGLHSGPVTAGVLRGEKSRFQLFGDTVNTASRMESTGKKDFIHISQSTADQLIEGGKESWITPREDLVSAKGKGEIQTYWVNSKTQRNASSSGTDPESGSGNDLSPLDHASKPSMSNTNDLDHHSTKNRKLKRLVDWQTDILTRLLKPVLAQRGNKSSKKIANPALVLTKGDCVLDEVAETLVLPKFDAVAAKANVNPNSIELSPAVIAQLRDFVTIMATRYLDNPFHNFEHASHVTMSASKLLNRIVIPEDMNYERKSEAVASDLHDYTYGITSDPLTQFTVIFCALIHDVDHRGVSNFQLANEIPEMATKYKNRGLAEQNSVDIAWDLLMQPQYKDLQKAIFSNEFELQRFRQLVVNLVMSTDIFDKDSKALRNSRWDKAFHRDPSALALSEEDTTNLKATIVIEHIIQAADVAHTMQHWHVYQKWNERLFQEMYVAFEQGRSATDPSAGWYKGELWFFDNYVIPLAKKLDECNVFGVASDEGLNYALANRAEWAIKGEDIVAEMLGRYTEQKNGVKLESGARSFV